MRRGALAESGRHAHCDRHTAVIVIGMTSHPAKQTDVAPGGDGISAFLSLPTALLSEVFSTVASSSPSMGDAVQQTIGEEAETDDAKNQDAAANASPVSRPPRSGWARETAEGETYASANAKTAALPPPPAARSGSSKDLSKSKDSIPKPQIV